jgi:hypothetical protein
MSGLRPLEPGFEKILEALARGELPHVSGYPDPPRTARRVFNGSLDPRDLDEAARREVFSSWLGAAVLHRMVDLLPPQELWDAVLLVHFPPLELPRILDQLYVHQDVQDAGLVARACAHLESTIAALTVPLSARLTASLGLPWTLGRIIDALTLALEAGGPRPEGASATQPLLLVLERLGVASVWELLPAARGSLSHRASEVPLEVLQGAAEALNLLGAAGTTTRLLVLLLLLNEPSRSEGAHRRLLTRLLVSREALVPRDRVVDVWTLANR